RPPHHLRRPVQPHRRAGTRRRARDRGPRGPLHLPGHLPGHRRTRRGGRARPRSWQAGPAAHPGVHHADDLPPRVLGRATAHRVRSAQGHRTQEGVTMYGWLWRRLPGGPRRRLLWAALLAAVAVVVLWYVVFPLLEPAVTLDEVTVDR